MSTDRKLLTWGCGIPAACCLGCVVLVLLFAGGLGGLAWWGLKKFTLHDDALARARSHPAVIEALGEPIERGWAFHGSIRSDGAGGSADFDFPLRGAKASGRLHVVAERRDGEWHYATLELRLDAGGTIDLLADEPPPESPLEEQEPSKEQGGPAAVKATGRRCPAVLSCRFLEARLGQTGAYLESV